MHFGVQLHNFRHKRMGEILGELVIIHPFLQFRVVQPPL